MGMKTDKSPKGNRVSSGMKDMNIEYRRKSQGSTLHNRLIFTFSFHYFHVSHYIPRFEEFFCILHSLSSLFKVFQKALIQFEVERLSNGFMIFAYFLRTKLRFLKLFFHNGNFRRPLKTPLISEFLKQKSFGSIYIYIRLLCSYPLLTSTALIAFFMFGRIQR